MTKKMKIPINVNQTEKYLVRIVRTKEIIAKFRLKQTAIEHLSCLKKIYVERLEIIKKSPSQSLKIENKHIIELKGGNNNNVRTRNNS